MFVLYLILGLLLVFLIILAVNTIKASAKAPKLQKSTAEHSEAEILRYAERLQKMIQCKTVSHADSFDDTEFKKLRNVVEELFPLIHEKAEKLTFSDDCWIYRLPSKDSSRNIMLMSHHDVVDVSGQWKYDGFSGQISEGKIWGRGTVDTKTPLFAEFSALEELLEAGFIPPCNVYIGSSHNEEICGDGVPQANDYFKKNGIKFEVILDEGGALIEPPLAGMKCDKCAMVAVHEKGRYYFDCTARAGTSHAGLTAGMALNPVERISEFITQALSGSVFIHRLNPQTDAMFRHLGPYCAFPMNVLFANLKIFGPLLKKLLPKINPQAAGLIGTTCTFKAIEGSASENYCRTRAFLRPVDWNDFEQDLKNFKDLAAKYDIEVTEAPGCEYHGPADMDKPQFAYTMDCIHKLFPQYPASPFILPAGSDARTFTDICECVLRFAPIRLSAQQLASVHSENENIDLDAVADAVSFYKYFLENYR